MPSGGKREGAGRPAKSTAPKVTVSISIDPRVLDAIDRMAGEGERSQWIEDAAKNRLVLMNTPTQEIRECQD